MKSLLTCPVCKGTLTKLNKTYKCLNNHSFDEAKEGYVNLYHNHSSNAGDDANMLLSRSYFLNQGYYQGIAEYLYDLIATSLQNQDKQAYALLDAGCGEGYYLDFVQNRLSNNSKTFTYYGFDISKKAIRMCSKKNQQINWFVANANEIPIENQSVDCFLNMFSYYNPKEVERVLAKDGIGFIFRAGKTHLLELKEILYPELLLKESDLDLEGTNLYCVEKKNLKQMITISSTEDIKHLLQMTPHVYKTNRENQAQLDQLESLQLTLDIDIYLIKQK